MDDGKRTQPYSLENMSIPELESLLQQCFIASESDGDPFDRADIPDAEYMMKITEVIMRKEKEAGIAEPSNVDEAWDRFQNFYMEGAMDDTSDDKIAPAASTMSHKGSRRTIRKVAIAAALIAVLVAMLAVPVAGYRNVFQMIASWTEEQFTFRPDGDTSKEVPNDGNADVLSHDIVLKEFESQQISKSRDYVSIQEALADYGISTSILPQTLPEGFEQMELQVDETSQGDIQFFSCYEGNGHYITYTVIYTTQLSSSIYEKNNISVDTYKAPNNLIFYMFLNEGNEVAVCYYDTLEISISTSLDRHTMTKLLDTIL